MGARVGLLTDAAMDAHEARGHPERPERRAAAVAGVEDGARVAGATLDRIAFEPASDSAIARIHPDHYVEALDEVAAHGGGWVDPDTFVAARSMEAARLAAGATMRAAREAAGGAAQVAFAVVRPPGHHAMATRASGFCLLNSIALAVADLRAAGIARRIAIVDWDVHHGDGTHSIFDADADLCYTSTHQMPLFPGTGSADERGSGEAVGTKHNRPLPPGAGDEAFLAAWREDLLPAIAAFRPEAILVSGGYDAHALDPLAELRVTDAGFGALAEAVGALARSVSVRGIALTLEGGYDLPALRSSVAASVEGLLRGLGAAPGYTRASE